MEQVEAIVHNSPALDSLKHQQLRSLCARHGLKSTGKKDHLIKRLKALRDRPFNDRNSEDSSSIATPLDGSFDILDEEEAEEAQRYSGTLPGSFESHTRPSNIGSRASIDEFGSLSADAHTITKSSSWKDKLASAFGGPTLSTSSSSDSLSSIRTTRAGIASSSRASDSHPAQTSSYGSEAYNQAGNTFKQPSSFGNAIASSSTCTQITNHAPPPPPTPAFRIVEDSFIQGNSTYPDCSFVPRSSFEGNSVDLTNVPVWPPPPGVILISPRQSPNKTHNGQGQAQIEQNSTNQRTPMSAQKRYLHDLEEDDDDEEEEGKYGSIRLIPRPALESTTTMMTPGRKIAALPKKISLIASSPPRFDLEAPPLPSFAAVANQAIRQDSKSRHIVEGEEGNSSGATVTMDNSENEENVRPSSDTLDSIHDTAPQQPFVFGSPRQQPLTDDSFLKRIDGFAIAKQLEELQRRTGAVTSSSSKSASIGTDGRSQIGFMPRTASSGNLQAKNGVRFQGKHEKEFKMMDSISNHYAARRKVSNSEMKNAHQPNKRTRTESADAVSALSAAQNGKTAQSTVHRQASCPALSLSNTASSSLSLNQQGRYAPIIPPRPNNVKSSAQQAEDRERVRNMQSGTFASSSGTTQRRAGRASVSPRKMAMNPSTRKLPPLASTISSNGNMDSNFLNSNTNGTASKLFKSTFTSLKSFGSSSSLSSKATLGVGMNSSSSSKSIHSQSQHVSDFGTLQQRTPAVTAHGSVTRPTIASLARQQSRQDLDNLASPRQALSPRPITSTDKRNIVSPRINATHSTLERKKTISSISASHRSSPMKGNLNDSIAQARRIRAKKLGSQIQANQQTSMPTNNATSSSIISRSPSKNLGLSSSHTTTGSVSSRPAWR